MIKLSKIISEIKLHPKITPESIFNLINSSKINRWELSNLLWKYGYLGGGSHSPDYRNDFINNMSLKNLNLLYSDLLKIKNKGEGGSNIDEIKLFSKNSFPKNILWAYKVNNPKELNNLLQKLNKLGYVSISSKNLPDFFGVGEYPCYIVNYYGRIGWLTIKQFEDDEFNMNYKNAIKLNEIKLFANKKLDVYYEPRWGMDAYNLILPDGKKIYINRGTGWWSIIASFPLDKIEKHLRIPYIKGKTNNYYIRIKDEFVNLIKQ